MECKPDDSLIGNCFEFFRVRIVELVTSGDAGQPKDLDGGQTTGPSASHEMDGATPAVRMDALITTLSELIRLVVIELDGVEDDAQVIFETLNARGTPLLASDLVKNHLFNRAQRVGMDVANLHDSYWSGLEDPWWTREDTVGRTSRHRLDMAIGYWAAAVNASVGEIAGTHLFSTFVEIASNRLDKPLSNEQQGVEDLFKEISLYATTWRSLREAAYSTQEGRFMSRLRDLGTSTPMPLVVWMAVRVGDGPEKISKFEFEASLLIIESYLVRRIALGLTPKNYNRIFASLLRVLETAGSTNISTVLTGSLRKYADESNIWPSDDSFRLALVEEDQYRKNLRGRTRMVLEGIELEMLGPDVDQLVPPGVSISSQNVPAGGVSSVGKKFTLEHVMPQRWEANWPMSDDHDESERVERNLAKHRLGNLTLVTGTNNTKLSNSDWARKSSYLKSRSLLLITQAQLLVRPYNPGEFRKYTPAEVQSDSDFLSLWMSNPVEAIRIRGEALAEWALKVWPRS